MKFVVISGLVVISGIIFFSEVGATEVNAQNWKANTADQIQISGDQKEYTMASGDTLWAIGQKLNVKHERLAEINGINLKSGEQYHLPVGRVINIEGNIATVKSADGNVVSQSIIREKDKVTPSESEVEKNKSESNQEITWKIPAGMREQLLAVGFEQDFLDNLSQKDYETAVNNANKKIAESGFGDVGAIFYELDNMFPGSWKQRPTDNTASEAVTPENTQESVNK